MNKVQEERRSAFFFSSEVHVASFTREREREEKQNRSNRDSRCDFEEKIHEPVEFLEMIELPVVRQQTIENSEADSAGKHRCGCEKGTDEEMTQTFDKERSESFGGGKEFWLLPEIPWPLVQPPAQRAPRSRKNPPRKLGRNFAP